MTWVWKWGRNTPKMANLKGTIWMKTKWISVMSLFSDETYNSNLGTTKPTTSGPEKCHQTLSREAFQNWPFIERSRQRKYFGLNNSRFQKKKIKPFPQDFDYPWLICVWELWTSEDIDEDIDDIDEDLVGSPAILPPNHHGSRSLESDSIKVLARLCARRLSNARHWSRSTWLGRGTWMETEDPQNTLILFQKTYFYKNNSCKLKNKNHFQ